MKKKTTFLGCEIFEKDLDGTDDNLVDECLCTAFNGIFKCYNFFALCLPVFCYKPTSNI